MPREAKVQCCVYENLIREGYCKYSAIASLLLRVYVAVKTEKRVKMGNYLCKSGRNKHDWWRRLMSGDFDELNFSLENGSNNHDKELTVRPFLHFIKIFCCFEVDGDRTCCCCGCKYTHA